MKHYHFLQHFLLGLATALALSSPLTANTLQLGGGIGAVEEGDDRLRPALHLHLGFGSSYFARLYTYGRTFGPIKETTYAVGAMRRFPMFGRYVLGSYGISALMESTDIESITSNEVQQERIQESQFNLGGIFGVYFETLPTNNFLFSIGWESHLYLAGPAGILLATARKQFLTATFGIGF